MLEENRRTHLSLKKNGGANMDDGDEDMKDEKPVEQIIEDVVRQEKWDGKRASKLDQDDFLSLLADFNSRGIHFA